MLHYMIDSLQIFLLGMSRSYELTYLESTSIPRKMNCHLVRDVKGMTLDKFTQNNFVVAGDDRGEVYFLLSLIQRDFPQVKIPNELKCSLTSI